MNQNQSFIGAYTRRRGEQNESQRPATPAALEPSSKQQVPQPEPVRAETSQWLDDGAGKVLRVDIPPASESPASDPSASDPSASDPSDDRAAVDSSTVSPTSDAAQAAEMLAAEMLGADLFTPGIVVVPMELRPELAGAFDVVTEFPVIQQPYSAPVESEADKIEPATLEPATPAPAEPAPHASEPHASEPMATADAPLKSQQPAVAKPPAPRWHGAAWEVDAFEIPTSVADLFFDEAFFREIAKRMGDSVRSGLRTILATSLTPGEGRSTVAIGTAIAAAATGLRVALVDVDLESPDQADLLRLDIASDWVEAIRGGKSLESVAITSLEDGVTLIPLARQNDAALPVTAMEMDRLLGRLEGCFDLVIYDGPVAQFWATARIAAAIDSCLIVRDARKTRTKQVTWAAQQLQNCGVTGIGVVDNFCS